jgi:3-deoxy-D-arabino-heptulosonate 7-phosphate (DAHP) synthase class II
MLREQLGFYGDFFRLSRRLPMGARAVADVTGGCRLVNSAKPEADRATVLVGGWRRKVESALASPAAQQPEWPSPERARAVCTALSQASGLVDPAEIDELTGRLAEVARGESLLLQGGDCAETFAQNTESHLRSNIVTLLQMAGLLAVSTTLPVVKVARIAGQFAKPRSSATDSLGLPAYRGDIVNSAFPSLRARTPDPGRMATAYRNSAAALETVRMVSRPGVDPVYVSHEMLLLDYERALLRTYERDGKRKLYNTSAHFLWIGERTRQLDGAHVALARLVANPIGLKLGPGISPDEAKKYVDMLNPADIPGRLTLICRLGSKNVRKILPAIVERIAGAGYHPIWLCDPMHGNTIESASGYKTRKFEQIIDELREFIEVHRKLGTYPAGIHVEMTGDQVTECLGGRRAIGDDDLAARYETGCDPRLNREQALEIAAAAASLHNFLH